MNYISTDKAPSAIGPYSQAIEYNGIIYTSGQIALTKDGEMRENDIEVQTRQVLNNLEKILEEANSNLNNVIKTTIYLVNIEDFAIVNEVYASFFKEHKPARVTVAVKELPKNALIEIEAIAKKRS